MAIPRSLAPLLLLVTVSVIPAFVLGSRVPASESLTKACNATVERETCENVLKSNPESATASPRRLAELAFQYLVKDGPVLVAESNLELAAAKDEATRNCLQSYDDQLTSYVVTVAAMGAPDQGEAKFIEARDKLRDLLRFRSNGAYSCPGHPIVFKIAKYERMLQITLDLMNAASPPPKAA
ncbi:hypothetical protein EJB05_13615, partial [Eragrostis curvula]